MLQVQILPRLPKNKMFTKEEYEKALIQVEQLWNPMLNEPTPELEKKFLDLVDAIEEYEEKHYPIN